MVGQKLVRRVLLVVTCLGLSNAIAATASAAPPLSIDAGFPSGNITVDRIEGDDAFIRQDLRDTAGHWFYWHFRVRNAQDRTVRFHFTNKNVLGPQGPAYSLDAGKTWQWLGSKRSNTEAAPPADGFLFRFPDDAAEVRFCFAIPYVESNLREFLDRHKESSSLRTDVLCKTPKGRAVEVLYLGRLAGPCDYRLAFTCRHHACESVANFVLEGLMESILADSETGRWFREHAAVAAIPFVDKDGVEEGDQGKNRKPHDHNRDYAGDSIYTTVAAIKKHLPQWSQGRLDMAIDLHCPSINDSLIQFIGGPEEDMWQRTLKLSQILESCQAGPLRHDAKRNVPFGTSWNTGTGLRTASFRGWTSGLPNIDIATTIEMPYSQVVKTQVTVEGARAVGRDLAEAIRKYLEKELPRKAESKQAQANAATAVFGFAATMLVAPAGSVAGETRLLGWDGGQLAAAQRQIGQRDSAALSAWKQLQSKADQAMKLTPPSVMTKSLTPPSGDKHDYLSFGPYWWPDPAKKDGLPYIQRDGEVNPESRGPTADWRSLATMTDAVETLSLAYHFSGDQRYAAKAAELLRVWFLDAETRMNPHLRFGQAIPGRTEGRGIGIIETRSLLEVVESVGLLAASEHWSDEDDRGLKSWFREYLDWMLTSRHGRDEDATRNNHGTWYDAQVVAFAWFTDQDELARERLKQVAARRIDTQVEPDGRQPQELARTRSFSYSTMNAHGLLTLATYGKRLGVDLWSHRGPKGQSIPAAIHFLARFADPSVEWRSKQITNFDRASDLQPLMAQAAAVFDDSEAGEALLKLAAQKQSPSAARLLWPSAWTSDKMARP